MDTIFVAMSGGVDSSFAAHLLRRSGHKVVGFTFDLLPSTFRNDRNRKMCCSAVNMNRAKQIAHRLSIPHYVINLRREFEEHVMGRFVEEYRAGRTPNPCVLCNRYIKFSVFLDKARAMGADRIATGHYAGIDQTPAGPLLKKGKDRTKDQSYFLYPIEGRHLPFISFPLAEYTKDRVRAELPLENGSRAVESQDICFIPDNDYRTFIARFIPGKKGPIVRTDGTRMGSHDGVHLYTVGQRRGINIPFTEPLYVVSLNTHENIVVVGSKDDLKRNVLVADDLNLLTPATEGKASAKVRYRQKEERCRYKVNGGALEVTFHDPVYSVTPGQSVVLYDGDTVLGGGTIREALG